MAADTKSLSPDMRMKKKRKFAIRLGKLAEEQAHYTIRPEIVKKLCNGKLAFSDLTEADFCIEIDQKGVDTPPINEKL